MQVEWYGQSAFRLTDGASTVVIDPFDDLSPVRERGRLFGFTFGGQRVAHLGDLGQRALRDEQARALGDLDVLFVPVGSGPTIGADQAAEIAARLRATIVVPMHYRTDRIDFLEPVDAFAQRAARVERFASPTFETEALPAGEGPLVVIPAPP
jgi:L-ascorbate metabolism protein UlaG (beta-lactamase superfamily)